MESNTLLGELNPCGGGDVIPMLKSRLLVGRRSSCDITLRFPNVSSHHCLLELINGYWQIEDLNSRNGIKVNGVRCNKKWLMPGDELSVAKHKFEIEYEPSGDAPPPEEADPFGVSLLEKAGLAKPDIADQKTRESDIPADNGAKEWQPDAGDDDPVMKWLAGE